MTYPAHMAAALSGTSLGQLAYWRSRRNGGPLMPPEYSDGKRALYSFRDVIALRTVAYLREDVSLQKIRKAIGTLRRLGNMQHLSAYRLVADGGTIIWLDDAYETGQNDGVDLVVRPGQHVLASMADVLAPFVNDAGVEILDFSAPKPKIEVDEGVLAGYPVIRGTRIPFDIVSELVEAGLSPKQISEYYPGVDKAAAGQAVEYARYVDTFRDRHAA